MNLQSDIRSISYVKSNAAEILRQVNDTHSPIVITQNGEATHPPVAFPSLHPCEGAGYAVVTPSCARH